MAKVTRSHRNAGVHDPYPFQTAQGGRAFFSNTSKPVDVFVKDRLDGIDEYEQSGITTIKPFQCHIQYITYKLCILMLSQSNTKKVLSRSTSLVKIHLYLHIAKNTKELENKAGFKCKVY